MRTSNKKPVQRDFISLTEAAQKTGLSRRWIYARMKQGTLPFRWYMLSPGKRLIDYADLENWIRTREIPPGGLPGER